MNPNDDPDRTTEQRDGGDLRRLLLVLAVLSLPVLVLVAIGSLVWSSFSTESFGPVAAGHGWVAFERQVDYVWPFDDGHEVWLGRSIDDRDSWRALAPGDTARVRRFTWVSPTHLRIQVPVGGADIGDVDAGWAREVEGVTIEWVR